MDLSPTPVEFAFMETLTAPSPYYPKVRGPYVCYLRNSERPHSRLDTQAQLRGINLLLDRRHCRCIEIATELEPLSSGRRPVLEEAIALCRKNRATLIFGKLNKMRGAKPWLDGLLSDWVRFRAADLPQLTIVTYQDLRWRERQRREDVGLVIKNAIAAKRKDRSVENYTSRNTVGLKKGPAASLKSRQSRALFRARSTLSYIHEVRKEGVVSFSGIAIRLNEYGHTAPRGGLWSAAQVRAFLMKFSD